MSPTDFGGVARTPRARPWRISHAPRLFATLKLPTTKTLTTIDCDYNMLTTLDLRGCPNVSRLEVAYNRLTSVLLSANHVSFEEFGLVYYGNDNLDKSELNAHYPY